MYTNFHTFTQETYIISKNYRKTHEKLHTLKKRLHTLKKKHTKIIAITLELTSSI